MDETSDISDDSDTELPPARTSTLSSAINLRQTISQGSFLPVTLVASKGLLAVNDYIVDESQGAKLVHFMGHFGKLKALRTFVDNFELKLDVEDACEHTIVHYAAR